MNYLHKKEYIKKLYPTKSDTAFIITMYFEATIT